MTLVEIEDGLKTMPNMIQDALKSKTKSFRFDPNSPSGFTLAEDLNSALWSETETAVADLTSLISKLNAMPGATKHPALIAKIKEVKRLRDQAYGVMKAAETRYQDKVAAWQQQALDAKNNERARLNNIWPPLPASVKQSEMDRLDAFILSTKPPR
jgi:hypothetical protein